jgi:diaminopropionate ammonia-lyase
MLHPAFASAKIRHFETSPKPQGAADKVLPASGFDAAIAEITQWEGYAPTPLYELTDLAETLGLEAILYKDEGPRFGIGSFKALGGSYAGLRVLQREVSALLGREASFADIRDGKHSAEAAQITLTSATDGNHGRSLAWGCQRFGAPCQIYIHAEVSEGRAEAMRAFGANVVRIDGDYDASVALTRAEAEANGWFVVSDTSWPGYSEPPRDVMAGYGVMTREACKAMTKAPTHVFLQGGVGGMAASVAAALRQYWGAQSPRVVVVEPELAACLIESAQNGTATTVAIAEETVMAGLSCGEPSGLAWEVLAEEAQDYLTIPDDIIGPTMRLLYRPTGKTPRIEAGESGVAGLAALISGALQPDLRAALGLDAGSRVLLIGSEGITDPEIFAELVLDHAGL